SLAYLNQFPIDVLKIDRAFVSKLGAGPEHAALVRSIIALATALNQRVTGEAVETAEQRLELERLGCHLGQGYFFSKPQPKQDCGAIRRNRVLAGAPTACRLTRQCQDETGESGDCCGGAA